MSRRFSLLQTPRISLRQPVQPHKRSRLVSSSVFLAVLHLSAEGERTGVHHSVVQHLWRSPVDARLLTLLFEKDCKEHLTFVSYLILFSQRLAFILHTMRDFFFWPFCLKLMNYTQLRLFKGATLEAISYYSFLFRFSGWRKPESLLK